MNFPLKFNFKHKPLELSLKSKGSVTVENLWKNFVFLGIFRNFSQLAVIEKNRIIELNAVLSCIDCIVDLMERR